MLQHRAYLENQKTPRVEGLTRAEACARYQGKVLLLARRVKERLSSAARVELDDLISWGAIGLLEAFDRFDAGRGIKFSTYAEYRIRGAMYDALRTQDTFSRRRRQLAKNVERAREEASRDLGRAPTSQEVAHRLECTVEQYHQAMTKTQPINHTSIDDVEPGGRPLVETLADPTIANASNGIASREIRELLGRAVSELPERQQECIMMYYGKELSLSEIAAVYGVSVSRVSQILKEARARLRKRLSSEIDQSDLALEFA